jgi:co-chaperonin GroES (HSP10)
MPTVMESVTRLEACRDTIVVKVVEEKVSKGGIALPENVGKHPEKGILGEVVARGAGRFVGERVVPLCVNPGDRLYFSKMRAFEFEHDGTKYWSLSEDGILAIVVNDD